MSKTDPLIHKTTRLTQRAWLYLLWERYAPVFALSALIFGLFLAASFGGLWQRFGDPWRAIALILSAYFIVKAAFKARHVDRPRQSAARRRVETDSGQAHRPIDTLHDTPALSENLWPTHYKAAREQAENLKPSKLRPTLSPIDPYFARFAMPVVLGLALMVGFGDNGERLRRAFLPYWTAGINPNDVTYDAWVDPPEYTGRPPVYFKNSRMAAIPEGSELVARISGAKTPPRLKLFSKGRSRYLKLKQLGPESYEARAILTDNARASWRIGAASKDWNLKVLPDNPPVVSFVETPEADKRDRLGFVYDFKDDYGVEKLELEMTLLTDDPDEAGLPKYVRITLPSRSVRQADRTAAQLDLTKHAWAGRKVTGRLIAFDGLGQRSKSETAWFSIPDKIFIEPLAKAIAEQRSLVMAGDGPYAELEPLTRKEWPDQPYFDTYEPRERMDRAPAQIQRAAVLIDTITIEPEDIYKDPAIYMGLKNVLGRLRYAREQDDLSGIPEDLWSIAIRAEFGLLGTALEDMREAEQALNEGMARRAPQREIDTLFSRYNEAVERYTEFLRQQALENGDMADNEGGGGGEGGRNVDEIEELLKAIEEANRVGDTEGARRALKQLAELLENMKIELAKGGGGSGEGMGEGAMSEEMKESLEELADLLGEQRELKDETEQAENEAEQEGEGQPGQGQGETEGSGPAPLSPRQLAEQQAALEGAVEALRQGLPEDEGQPGGQDGEGAGSEPGGQQPGAGSQPGEGEDGGGSDPGEGPGQGTQPGDQEGSGGGAGGLEDPEGALGRAGTAMAESRRSLEAGDLAGAAQAQSDAIEALREAGKSLAAQATGQSGEDGQSGDSAQADPLGRNETGSTDTETDADIDMRDNATKTRDLMEELRRRAAEQDRDASEREYLERLMKRF